MASFSFSFSGDDIEGDDHDVVAPPTTATAVSHEAATSPSSASAAAPAASAFPVQGKPQLPPLRHSLKDMLARLPSKIAYGLLNVGLEADDSSNSSTLWIHLPRRELWDVRLQVMAEADDDDNDDNDNNDTAGEIAPGLGSHDVKTGIYEGGFKSWESSVDLVKVLLQSDAESPSSSRLSAVAANVLSRQGPARVVELGCGTALPSLAIFQWACANRAPEQNGSRPPLSFTVADYNPSVLHLVTLPNLLLVWAMQRRHVEPVLLEALDDEDEDGTENTPGGELQLTDAVKDAFCAFLDATGITLSLLSGGWSPAFAELLYTSDDTSSTNTLVLGAETIYSPFALESFSDTLLAVLRHEHGAAAKAAAVVGAKKLYFGVGGSLDDFVRRMRDAGALVTELREEADGVRRGVVQCLLA